MPAAPALDHATITSISAACDPHREYQLNCRKKFSNLTVFQILVHLSQLIVSLWLTPVKRTSILASLANLLHLVLWLAPKDQ